ncbi:MAG: hypothetical protein GY820_10825 [Gammaproteobacteria bacterium]|nr:hypothetical protein [Gammaproteobacteria bacterium]
MFNPRNLARIESRAAASSTNVGTPKPAEPEPCRGMHVLLTPRGVRGSFAFLPPRRTPARPASSARKL